MNPRTLTALARFVDGHGLSMGYTTCAAYSGSTVWEAEHPGSCVTRRSLALSGHLIGPTARPSKVGLGWEPCWAPAVVVRASHDRLKQEAELDANS